MALNDVFETRQELNREILRDSFRAFIIYGAGSAGRDVCKILTEKKYPVACFIDKNAENNGSYNGIPVILPEKAAVMDKKNTCVVIGMMNANYDVREIRDHLAEMGFKDIINFYEFYHIFPGELGDRFFMQTKEYYKNNRENVISGMEIWDDEKSKKTYEQAFAFRYTGNLLYSPAPDDTGTQYFPGDVPGWGRPDRFIDCGAYDGDTLKAVFKRFGKIRSIAAFEPDVENFQKLAAAKDGMEAADEVILFPCGVYSSAKQLRFSANKGSGSLIDTKGDTMIQTVSLDEALTGYGPDIIKMDIEGAEFDALKGAERIIKKYRPNLAVCLYHRPEDIWRIPGLIKSWGLGYKFYLRVFCHQSFDLVLFAVK